MSIVTIGIDLAKKVFAVHGVDATGKPMLVRPDARRVRLLELVGSLPLRNRSLTPIRTPIRRSFCGQRWNSADGKQAQCRDNRPHAPPSPWVRFDFAAGPEPRSRATYHKAGLRNGSTHCGRSRRGWMGWPFSDWPSHPCGIDKATGERITPSESGANPNRP